MSASALAAAGFDLAEPFDVRAAAARDPRLAILASGPERTGILVGNTRALWVPFSAALEDLAGESDPLDRYSERSIGAAFPGARIYYSHVAYAGAFVPLQHLAVAIGFGALSPGHLVIHPTFGPWLALRAVAMIDAEPPPLAAPMVRPCGCDAACEAALAHARAAQTPEAWSAVRAACHLRAHRYSDEQLRYHDARAWQRR